MVALHAAAAAAAEGLFALTSFCSCTYQLQNVRHSFFIMSAKDIMFSVAFVLFVRLEVCTL